MGKNYKDCSQLQESIVKGGRAGFNSVMYLSNTHRVIATRDGYGDVDIKVKYINHSRFEKLSLLFGKTPFIRGVWVLLDGFVIAWKLSIVILLLVIINLFLLNGLVYDKSSEGIGNIYTSVISDFRINFILILAILLICAFLNKFTELGKFHSAEHMVDNAYVASKNLNLSSVLKYSRIHQSCGTNLMVFILLFYLLFIFITDDFMVSIFLSYILGYEVYMIKNPIIKYLLKPFYLIGYLIQYHIFTSVPEKKHLEVAVVAYKTLLDESRKNL